MKSLVKKLTSKVLVGALIFGTLLFAGNTTEAASIEGDKLTIEKGDTLYQIEKNLGIKVQDLKDANDLKSDQIKIGQTLKLPKTEVKGEIKVIGKVDGNSIEVYHVETKEYYVIRVNEDQMKKITKKKKIKAIVFTQGTNSLQNWK